jgi:hypothetical protein
MVKRTVFFVFIVLLVSCTPKSSNIIRNDVSGVLVSNQSARFNFSMLIGGAVTEGGAPNTPSSTPIYIKLSNVEPPNSVFKVEYQYVSMRGVSGVLASKKSAADIENIPLPTPSGSYHFRVSQWLPGTSEPVNAHDFKVSRTCDTSSSVSNALNTGSITANDIAINIQATGLQSPFSPYFSINPSNPFGATVSNYVCGFDINNIGLIEVSNVLCKDGLPVGMNRSSLNLAEGVKHLASPRFRYKINWPRGLRPNNVTLLEDLRYSSDMSVFPTLRSFDSMNVFVSDGCAAPVQKVVANAPVLGGDAYPVPNSGLGSIGADPISAIANNGLFSSQPVGTALNSKQFYIFFASYAGSSVVHNKGFYTTANVSMDALQDLKRFVQQVSDSIKRAALNGSTPQPIPYNMIVSAADTRPTAGSVVDFTLNLKCGFTPSDVQVCSNGIDCLSTDDTQPVMDRMGNSAEFSPEVKGTFQCSSGMDTALSQSAGRSSELRVPTGDFSTQTTNVYKNNDVEARGEFKFLLAKAGSCVGVSGGEQLNIKAFLINYKGIFKADVKSGNELPMIGSFQRGYQSNVSVACSGSATGGEQ